MSRGRRKLLIAIVAFAAGGVAGIGAFHGAEHSHRNLVHARAPTISAASSSGHALALGVEAASPRVSTYHASTGDSALSSVSDALAASVAEPRPVEVRQKDERLSARRAVSSSGPARNSDARWEAPSLIVDPWARESRRAR